MIIGGQHISGACTYMRNKLFSESDAVGDAELPLPYRVVSAVVLKSNTPLHALVNAAGYHQSTQQDNIETSFTDVMRIFARQSYHNSKRNPRNIFLTDEEVCACIQAMGLIRGDKDIMRQQDSVSVSNDQAMNHIIKVRTNMVQMWRSTSRFTIANKSHLQELINKIDQLNEVKEKELPPFRPQTFRENVGLMQEDYLDLGRWILGRSKLNLKELIQQMVLLKKRRAARWHIYTAPDDFVHPSNRNEVMVNMLSTEVPYGALRHGKRGGPFWKKLKDGIIDSPGWDCLKTAELWTDSVNYRGIRRRLDNTVDTTRAAVSTLIAAEKGRVEQTQLDIIDHETQAIKLSKQFMMGPPLGLMAVCQATAMIFELDSWETEMTQWHMNLINHDHSLPIAFVGNNKTTADMARILRLDEHRQRHQQRRITIYADEEPCFGPKDEKALSKEVIVLLVTPPTARLPPHRPYIALRGVFDADRGVRLPDSAAGHPTGQSHPQHCVRTQQVETTG